MRGLVSGCSNQDRTFRKLTSFKCITTLYKYVFRISNVFVCACIVYHRILIVRRGSINYGINYLLT